MFDYKIVRKPHRKQLTITVNTANQIIVKANITLPLSRINEFVKSKYDWIKKICEKNRSAALLYNPKRFVDGERFLCLGKYYSLCLKKATRAHIELNCNSLDFFIPNRFFKNTVYKKNKLITWYKCAAYEVIFKKICYFKKIIGVEVSEIMIRDLKRSWAICSTDGILTFSWRLLMAPLEIIDYVVVHELSHRICHNHSSKFWRKVESIMPEYKKHKAWLKKNENCFLW
jgi:predicted metal-dependent hydrolase